MKVRSFEIGVSGPQSGGAIITVFQKYTPANFATFGEVILNLSLEWDQVIVRSTLQEVPNE